MPICTVTVIHNDIMKGQRTISDIESFIYKAYTAFGYPAVDEIVSTAMADIEAGDIVRIDNPAQNTVMKIRSIKQ